MPSFASAFRHRSNSAPPLSQFGPHAVADPMPDREERPERTGRRRPFSSLMKKLKSMKPGDAVRHASSKKNNSKKQADNNPYSAVGRSNSDHVQIALTPPPTSHYSVSSTRSARTSSTTSVDPSDDSVRLSTDGHPPPTMGGRSTIAPTVVTDHETSCSMAAPSYGASSVTGTTRTANIDSRRGNDSTFSSPAPSVRSLTTTLTTIQSFVPNGAAATHNNSNPNSTNMSNSPNHHHHNHHSHHSTSQIIHFNQPFPTTATPVSAIPAHLVPSGQGGNSPFYPTTYHTATANNLLTDNASILTLASSSKRRRRRSFDTDASVRALAPSSLFGGSRESLPLSVLSSNMEGGTIGGMSGATTPGGLYRGPNALTNDRTSIYSSTTGILASDRNSFYSKQAIGGTGVGGDAASVRSGLLGHGRAESINGSIGGGLTPAPMNGVASAGSLVGLTAATSPNTLASPRDRDRERRISGGVGNVDEDVEGEERA
ncbi:unnamed protein product [Sordaria macrospora k-hell]|uniref:WGS project CABT00000000 data, contig 2.15 n=1 Tax=Sordaria macrospora (strain ATCC MYA-333 / DSM 997 / K(L3346) / K-hell) TaxID=771870 RepID=F7VZG0_SORMK|nr:uncharacterized protein SMAC_04138 [Sordaria macrospora k-hell]CCC10908.1 unnamed protein product [Sordaria macrospora k-hell]